MVTYYLEKVHAVLKPNGMFGMTCFDTSGGENKEDWEIYEEGRMPLESGTQKMTSRYPAIPL